MQETEHHGNRPKTTNFIRQYSSSKPFCISNLNSQARRSLVLSNGCKERPKHALKLSLPTEEASSETYVKDWLDNSTNGPQFESHLPQMDGTKSNPPYPEQSGCKQFQNEDQHSRSISSRKTHIIDITLPVTYRDAAYRADSSPSPSSSSSSSNGFRKPDKHRIRPTHQSFKKDMPFEYPWLTNRLGYASRFQSQQVKASRIKKIS